MILLIDNYDSFTYNLVQRIGEMDPTLKLHVVRNDQITVEQAQAMHPEYLIISPGPCTPKEGGISNDMIRHFAGRIPMLGVCLGHQCMGHVHGMIVERNFRLMHGKTSQVFHDGKTIFKDLPNPFTATRYHSLTVRRDSVPDDWTISAWTEEGEVMAMRKTDSAEPIEGVQFHPESFLCPHGMHLLANFLHLPTPKLPTEQTH